MKSHENAHLVRRGLCVGLACAAAALGLSAALATTAGAAARGPRAVKKTAFFYWVSPVLPAWGTTKFRDPSRYQHVVNEDPRRGALTRSVATRRGVYIRLRSV